MEKKIEACLICGEELEYFETGREMECEICHRKVVSKAACKRGHFVCDSCHSSSALENIRTICLGTKSRNPIEIAVEMMHAPNVHMHGPENHVLVGSALLAAFKNCGGAIELEKAQKELEERGSKVPGGVCGFWGCCGAAVSAGMFVSIVTGATPITGESWGMANTMTSNALSRIGGIGGPRCCKRNAFLSIREAAEFSEKHLNIKMKMPEKIICTFSAKNRECIGKHCPFNHQPNI